MSDALEAIEIGVEKIKQKGWGVRVVMTAPGDGGGRITVSDVVVGDLTWSEALSVRFREQESLLRDGYTGDLPTMRHRLTGFHVTFSIGWYGVKEEVKDESGL